MGDGDIAEAGIARQPTRFEKHLQVHHVVDNHQIGVRKTVFVVPRADQTHPGIETFEQRLRRLHQQSFVGFVAGEPQCETYRAADHEAQVVRLPVGRESGEGRCAAACAPKPRRVLRLVVKEPQAAGEKAAYPAADAFQFEGARTVQARRIACRVREFGIQLRRLNAGALQRSADEPLCERFRNDQCRSEATEESKKSFLHTIVLVFNGLMSCSSPKTDGRRATVAFRFSGF